MITVCGGKSTFCPRIVSVLGRAAGLALAPSWPAGVEVPEELPPLQAATVATQKRARMTTTPRRTACDGDGISNQNAIVAGLPGQANGKQDAKGANADNEMWQQTGARSLGNSTLLWALRVRPGTFLDRTI